MLVSKEAFDSQILKNCYTNVYIYSDYIAEAETFSQEYTNRCHLLMEDIKVLGKTKSKQTYDEMMKQAHLKGDSSTIVHAMWNVFGRTANPSYVMFQSSFDTIRRLKISFAIIYIIVVVCGAVVIMLVSTWFFCIQLINTPTVTLLSPTEVKNIQPIYFEKYSWWKKRTLYKKAMIRNLVKDRKYVISTIIGVTGCTALLIIGFTLKFSIQGVTEEQYKKIQCYDMKLLTKCETQDDVARFDAILQKEKNITYSKTFTTTNCVKVNKDEYLNGDIIVVYSDRINEYFTLNKKGGGQLYVLKKGVIVSALFNDYYGVEKGDYLEIFDQNGVSRMVEVIDFFVNYVNHFIFMSTEYYQEMFGIESVPNTFYVKLDEANVDTVKHDLSKIEGYIEFSDKSMGIQIFEEIADSINSVIRLIIVLSGIMALVVNTFARSRIKRLRLSNINIMD